MDKVLIDMGVNIKRARTKAKMSQIVLAKKVGVVSTHISHIENGKTIPSLNTLVEIMRVLRIQPNKLFLECVDEARGRLTEATAQVFDGCNQREIRKLSKQFEVMRDIELEYRIANKSFE